jgi:hypothetical protein
MFCICNFHLLHFVILIIHWILIFIRPWSWLSVCTEAPAIVDIRVRSLIRHENSGFWNILAEVQEAIQNPGFSCLLTTLQIIWMEELEIVPSGWHGTTTHSVLIMYFYLSKHYLLVHRAHYISWQVSGARIHYIQDEGSKIFTRFGELLCLDLSWVYECKLFRHNAPVRGCLFSIQKNFHPIISNI